MVHAIELRDGEARYRNRWVRTDVAADLLGEDPIAGQPPEVNPTPSIAHRRASSRTPARSSRCTRRRYRRSSTPNLKTIGRYDFDGALRSPMTAHPKIDPVTGEMLFFGYDIVRAAVPALPRRRPAAASSCSRRRSRSRGPTMMHDFAITERHVVFLDLPVVYDLGLAGQRPFSAQWKPEYGARVGVMPRDASTAPRWFDVEPCYVFHTVNAYDEGDTVVLDVVRHAQMFTDDLYGIGRRDRNARSMDDRPAMPVESGSSASTIDTQEFPRVDPRIVGRRHRYAYTATARVGDFVEPFGTLLQHDLKSGTTTAAKLGPGRQAGEGVFVPASTNGAEDEGWVLSVVYNAPEDRSDLVILDATDFGGEAGRDGCASPAGSLRVPRHLGTGPEGSMNAIRIRGRRLSVVLGTGLLAALLAGCTLGTTTMPSGSIAATIACPEAGSPTFVPGPGTTHVRLQVLRSTATVPLRAFIWQNSSPISYFAGLLWDGTRSAGSKEIAWARSRSRGCSSGPGTTDSSPTPPTPPGRSLPSIKTARTSGSRA